jgi:hypothetical protein
MTGQTCVVVNGDGRTTRRRSMSCTGAPRCATAKSCARARPASPCWRAPIPTSRRASQPVPAVGHRHGHGAGDELPARDPGAPRLGGRRHVPPRPARLELSPANDRRRGALHEGQLHPRTRANALRGQRVRRADGIKARATASATCAARQACEGRTAGLQCRPNPRILGLAITTSARILCRDLA